MYISSIFVIAILKQSFYVALGFFLNMEPTTIMDDFWLFDHPINPHNCPTTLIFNRTKMDPEKFLKSILKNTSHPSKRMMVKTVKILGKYFFVGLNE